VPRNPSQDRLLTRDDLRKLVEAGYDIHDLKGGKRTGALDLYKDDQGNIYLKPKGGAGEGDPLGINLNDLGLA
jgi:hypothetical protein